MDGYISSFLEAHRHSIDTASLTADELYIELKSDHTLSVDEVLMFVTDLITYVHPIKAKLDLRRRAITLGLS